MRGHVRPGARARRPSGPSPEHAGRGPQVIDVDAAAFGRVGRCERGDRSTERVQIADPRLAELVVDHALFEHQVDHPGQERRVLTGADLQEDVGEGGELGAARVDHDQLHSPLLRSAHHREGVGPLEPADGAVARDHGVVSDGHGHIGVTEVLVPGFPCAEPGRGRRLRRLVDGDRRVERRRAEALVPRTRCRHRDRVLVAAGARVRGDGSRPVQIDDRA